MINPASAEVGTSVLRPIFTVRSLFRCISLYRVDLLMPSDRAASLGDIAIGAFISGVTFLLIVFVRHPDGLRHVFIYIFR